MDPLKFPASGLLIEVECREETFLPGSTGLVFSVHAVEAPESLHFVMIDIPNGSKVMRYLAETRTRQNLSDKGGGTEIDPSPVRDELEYP